MTREQKLALVLGFAAVLVVGLLISDHMAAARSASLEAAPHDASVVIDASEGQALRRVVTLPDRSTQRAAGEAEVSPADSEQRYRGRPVTRMASRSTDSQATSVPEREQEIVADAAPAPVKFVTGSRGGIQRPADRDSILEQVGDRMANGAEAVAQGIRDFTGLASATPFSGLAQLDNAPGSPVSREASTERVVVQHHVQVNESLYKIAERYYGDGNKWQRIAEDNSDRVGRNGSVREGVMLRVFDPTRNRPVASSKPARRSQPTQPKPTGGPLTYTVQSGDTLGEISQKLLGTIRRQHELIALNREVLSDPDRLRAGMVLKLPSS
ncbi:MAG: LysM peptidoglycan-binding domain-containing protein [Planctomycetota bacterium]